MIFNAKTKAVIPLLNLSESKENGLDNLIKDLETNSGDIVLPIKHFGDVKLNFKFLNEIPRNDFDKKKKYDLYLIVESEFDLDLIKIAKEAKIESSGGGEATNDILEKINEIIPEFSSKLDELPPEFFVPAAYKLFHNTYLKHFLWFTQIAHPGTLWTDDANIYVNDNQIESIKGFTSVLYEYDFKSNNWPPIKNLSVNQVWNYVTQKTKVLEEFSTTEIERALNAFSYIFSRHYLDNIPVSLFWTISGLEALYVQGESGITQQLNDKIQVFLGNIEQNKKRLKKLYNYRSSLIHGGLNIPLNDSLIEDEKHQIELYEMNAFGAVVLISTLQKIISEELTELTFRYEYK